MAKKGQDVRPKITLACTGCKEHDYIARKNRRNGPGRIELKKYYPCYHTHRTHREIR